MAGLDQNAEADRKMFYQAHYSFARSMFKLHRINENLEQTLGAVSDYDSFESAQDTLFTYCSYIGHVRDMFKIIEESLSFVGQFYSTLQEFYAQRSHVIHGPRIPARIEDGLLQIPAIGGENLVFGEWANKSTWDSVPPDKFGFMQEFVADTTNAFTRIVNELHGKVFDAADRRFGGKRIEEAVFKSATLASLSGSTFAPAISGYQPPPSGVAPPPANSGRSQTSQGDRNG